MNDILSQILPYLFQAAPFLLVILGVCIWFASVVLFPRQLLVAIVLLIILAQPVTSTSFEAGVGVDLYGKGASLFVISILEWTIILIAIATTLQIRNRDASLAIGSHAGQYPGVGNSYLKWYLVLFSLVLWHIAISLDSPKESVLQILLARNGAFYIIMQALLVASLLFYVNNREDIKKIALIILYGIGLRMLWGGVRYVAFGGDVTTYDIDGEVGSLKISFWDVNDAVLGSMFAAMLIWLAASSPEKNSKRSVIYFSAALFALALIFLSARRSLQGGALLMLLALPFMLPKGRRWLVVLIIALALPVAAYKLQARMGNSGGWMEKIFNAEQKGKTYLVDPRRQRYYELEMALKTIEKNLLVGVGPAGQFEVPSSFGLEYHGGNYGFVHSGFVHILLKLGIFGLIAFLGLLYQYLRNVRQAWRVAAAEDRGLLVASLGGFISLLPTMAFGTPMIDARHMLLMGFIFALPAMVLKVSASSTSLLGPNKGPEVRVWPYAVPQTQQ